MIPFLPIDDNMFKPLSTIYMYQRLFPYNSFLLIFPQSLQEAVYNDKKVKMNIRYSIVIQGSPNNGAFQWINHYRFRNPFITSMTALFKTTQNEAVFYNIDEMNWLDGMSDRGRG